MSASVKSGEPHWSSLREAGTLTGLRFLMLIYRCFGRRIFSFLLFPVAIYFVLFRPIARRASLDFLRSHQQHFPKQWTHKPNLWHVIMHFQSFAETILDKLLAWSAEISIDEFDLPNPELVEQFMADQRGQLIIGTHLGNLEYCRGFIQRYRNTAINILIYDKHAINFINMMQRMNPNSRLNIFQVDEFDVATLLQLKNKIDLGERIFIAGDRVPLTGHERTVPTTFLNRIAPLPIGPYMLAKALACPVKLMFAYREQGVHSKIRFDVVPFTDQLTLTRSQRELDLQRYAQQFASELEQQCAKVPYQWFNFYDFWALTEKPTKQKSLKTKVTL